MTNEDQKEFMEAQIHRIEVDKWIESEKAGHDLGESYVREWIKQHSADFRDEWVKEHIYDK